MRIAVAMEDKCGYIKSSLNTINPYHLPNTSYFGEKDIYSVDREIYRALNTQFIIPRVDTGINIGGTPCNISIPL